MIKRCIPLMTGLNEAARDFLFLKNQPVRFHEEVSSFFTLVVVSNDTVVGVGALHGNEVKRVYVDPTLQGRGCGSVLLQHLEAEARRQGTQELWVESSLNAASFYAQRGYRATTNDRLTIDQARFDFVRMTKVLTDNTER